MFRISASSGRPALADARPPTTAGVAAADAVVWGTRLALAERACCCPARPTAVALLPAPAGGSSPVDLLLCGHHYRASRPGLEAAGATFYHAA